MENWNACWRSLEIFLQSIRQLARFLSSQRAAGMHPFSDRILRTSLCQGSHSKKQTPFPDYLEQGLEERHSKDGDRW